MGDGVTIRCPRCRYEVDAPLGVGFKYGDLRNVIDQVPFWRRLRVSRILNQHSVQSTDFAHALLVCPKCGRFGSRFYYKIEYDQGKVEESVYRCRICWTVMELHDGNREELGKTTCPRCHRAKLVTQEHCCWD